MLTLSTGKAEWARIYNFQQHEVTREINEYWETILHHAGLLDGKGEPKKNAVADMMLVNGYGPKAPALAIRVKLKKRDGAYVLPILTQERVR